MYTGSGLMINSDEYDGRDSEEFKEEVVIRLEKEEKGERSVQYKLRPQVFSRQRYWGEPIPLVYREDGSIEAVSDSAFPVELPPMEDFLPGKDRISPLAKNDAWVQTTDSKGNPARRETDTMPTWAGSNWYYLRYVDPKNDKEIVDPKKVKYWFPVDMYFGDAGHTTAHLLYSRFWFRFLYNIGAVPLEEPYMYRMSGGMLLGPDGHKMSKSRGNTILPQEVLENYGADAVRTYLAFIGPYEDTYPWNPNGLVACARLVKSIYETRDKVSDVKVDVLSNRMLHQLIKRTTKMMSNLKMNTAVSEIMIFNNYLKKQKEIPEELWVSFIKVVAPFMPFVAEELWQEINGFKEWKKENSVHLQKWPEFDEKLAMEEKIELPIQVNGKLRAKIMVDLDISEDEAIEVALKIKIVAKYIKGKKPKKVIYVQNSILNFVI